MYPPELVAPMKEELVNVGFTALLDETAVDTAFSEKAATALVVVNSVCGCAAGSMRPGVIKSLSSAKKT